MPGLRREGLPHRRLTGRVEIAICDPRRRRGSRHFPGCLDSAIRGLAGRPGGLATWRPRGLAAPRPGDLGGLSPPGALRRRNRLPLLASAARTASRFGFRCPNRPYPDEERHPPPGRSSRSERAVRPPGGPNPFARIVRHPRPVRTDEAPRCQHDLSSRSTSAARTFALPSCSTMGRESPRPGACTPVADGPAAVLRDCEAALRAAVRDAPAESRDGIVGIGICTPGPLDPWRGVVLQTPNMGPHFVDVPIAAELGAALGLPAFLERDTNVAALGEMAFGAARGCPDFVYLTVSTGVGGSIVSDGRIFHGPDGTAGELGHTPVAMEGLCGCGAVGHLEAFIGGASMARVRSRGRSGRREPVSWPPAPTGKGSARLRPATWPTARTPGDETCRAIMERGRRAFAVACVGFVDSLNPTRIVVGGAIADAQGERLLAPARAEVADTAFRTPRSRVQIVPAELGADVGLAGSSPTRDRASRRPGLARRSGNPNLRALRVT